MRPPFSRTWFDLLEEQAGRDLQAVAAVTPTGRASYVELANRVRGLARRLSEEGIRRHDRVGLLLDNRLEWLEVFSAANALGAVTVPFSTWSTAAELEFLIQDSQIKMLFTLDRLGPRDFVADLKGLEVARELFANRRVVSVRDASDPRPDTPADDADQDYREYRSAADGLSLVPGIAASASDTMVIVYTSGSSARPKAVPLQNSATLENGFNIGERMGLTPADRVFVPVPWFWSYGVANALPATATHGATLVSQRRFAADDALDLIEAHRCSAIYTLPAITNALLDAPDFTPTRTASLRTGLTIGSPQDVERAAQRLGAAEICNVYGSTESYGNCCVTWHHWPLERRAHCQGPPLPGVTVRIRDPETDQPCANGETGLVEVSGWVTPGYLGDSAQHNAATFTDDGYFRSGDLGALDDAGALRFTGRSNEMIKRSGINVSPAEIEEALQKHAAVGIAGVTGLDSTDKGETIVAFVVPRAGHFPTPAELVSHCAALLSKYKIPDRLELCDALPLTPTGKVLRKALRKMAADLTMPSA